MSDERPTAVSGELLREIEQLLYWEAFLLDHRRFREWLELLSDGLQYHAPVRSNENDENLDHPNRQAHFDDRKADLAARIARFGTGSAWAEEPPSRVRRMISNVLVMGQDEEGVEVHSSFLVTFSRYDMPARIFSGSRRDYWATEKGQRRLKKRRIVFDLSDIRNVTFFV